MKNKTIIGFGFRILCRNVEVLEGVIRLGLLPRPILPSSTSIILHKILSSIHSLIINSFDHSLHLKLSRKSRSISFFQLFGL